MTLLARRGAEIARELISTPGPPRSKPGRPPHIDQGDLIASVYDEPHPELFYADYGSPMAYAMALEKGSYKMEPRPWLRPSLLRLKREYKEIASQVFW